MIMGLFVSCYTVSTSRMIMIGIICLMLDSIYQSYDHFDWIICLLLDCIYQFYDHDDGIVCLVLDSIYKSYDHDVCGIVCLVRQYLPVL